MTVNQYLRADQEEQWNLRTLDVRRMKCAKLNLEDVVVIALLVTTVETAFVYVSTLVCDIIIPLFNNDLNLFFFNSYPFTFMLLRNGNIHYSKKLVEQTFDLIILGKLQQVTIHGS